MEEKSPSEGDKIDCKVFVDLTSQPLSNTDSMSTGSNPSQQNLVRPENGGGTASNGSGPDEDVVEAQDKTLSAELADQPVDEGSAAGEEVIISGCKYYLQLVV